jgi:hypothetical protein
MNPKQFLQIGGGILLLLGIVGYAGVFSDTKSAFYLDNGENIAHTVLGVVAIGASFLLKDATLQKWLVAIVGVTALAATVIGFLVAGNAQPNLSVTNLESPADDVLHLVVGIWALAVAFRPMGASAMSASKA